MRRKRAPRVVWLPPDLTIRSPFGGTATTEDDQGIFEVAHTGPAIGVVADVKVTPVVKDTQQLLVASDATLSDIENNGYRLRRLVGKISWLVAQGVAADPTDPTLYQVGCGFIILRTSDGTNPLQTASAYDPLAIRSWGDPWIWRRTWVLADQVAIAAGQNNIPAPRTNLEYGGGNADGPHLDQKTARLIGPEERLFFVSSVRGLDGDPQAANPGLLLCLGDVRVLASMRTSVGNRRNASR